MRGNIQDTAQVRAPRLRQVLLVVLAVLALQLGSLISPAYACGCGAMVLDRQSHMSVDRETSVVGWDGRTEQILMRFTVDGDAPKAAWIMPVPNRATVELGDNALFDELETVIAPEHRTRHYFWPRGDDWPFSSDSRDSAGAQAPGKGAPEVGVVGRERLGDFDVARLTATDPGALRGWLEQNGFELPDGLTAELKPYVAQKWEYVAVRLAPEAEGSVLRGTLDPLRLRFASDRLIYPMRLSRLARTPQSLGLFVLAPHRMEPRSPIGGGAPGGTDAGKGRPSGVIDSFTGGSGGETFLTALDQEFPEPRRIDGDHELRAAAKDTPFRRVVYDDELLTAGGFPVWVLTVGGGLAVPAAVALRGLRARRRRPVVPPPAIHVPPPIA
ncbi:DUF2330 domain-containing protein [Streptomyces lunaelactis]|uniref:DUF2330 domain-containing protein n=1 Tax=Streptomyces lunaelactis TaxID=1535768 RepID=UPI0015856E7F|nr:DUF2330 domain-containing protein [Streptomyces lunaelactis]NUK73900.1 DUF2330 domain-containing protein [Streptomyces lunaelactis]